MFRTLIALVLTLVLAPSAWAQSSYRLKPGDVLQMEVLEDNSLNRNLLVLPDGTVSVPLAGTVSAAGQSVDSVKAAITSALASNFASPPTVFLSVSQVSQIPQTAASLNGITGPTIPVYALGEFAKSGRIDVSAGTTLLQFLADAGGLSKFAAAKRIQLRRADHRTGLESVYQFDYKAVQAGAKAPVIVLQAGDVIVIPERRLFE